MIKIIKSLSIIAAVVAVVIGGTYAWFTAADNTATTTADSATLSLDGAGFNSFNFGEIVGHMAPGDKTQDATIIIKNDGTTNLAWFGDLVVTGGDKLREAIYIDYAKTEFLAPDGSKTWEPMDEYINNGIYKYNNANNSYHIPFGKVSLKAWDGNSDMAPGTGYEYMGALKPGYSYKLTLRFGFAEGATNEYQSNVTDPVNISFKVDATQIETEALNALKATLGNHYNWLNLQIDKQDKIN